MPPIVSPPTLRLPFCGCAHASALIPPRFSSCAPAGSECDVPLLVTGLIRTQHCGVCLRAFCGSCTRNTLPPPRDAAPDQAPMHVCNYCERA